MIIAMVESECFESYCSSCEQWSPDEKWEYSDTYDDDGEWLASSIVCPGCGHGFPEHDPPMRRL
jgi:hypothetical protein